MNGSLLIHHPNGSTTSHGLEQPCVRIGRAADNDIVLIDVDRSVSRWHVQFEREGDETYVTDLNSSNGTWISGRRITARHKLCPNDIIDAGQYRIVFADYAAGEAVKPPEPAENSRFEIESGAVELDELQKEPARLKLPVGATTTAPDMLKHLELLYEVGIRLGRSHSVEEVTGAAIDLLFKIPTVHRATVMLWDEDLQAFSGSDLHMRNVGKVKAVEDSSYDPASLVMSQTILSRVRQENRPLLIRDVKSEAMLESSMSIVRAGIQAALCAPLSLQGRFLGIIYSDNLAEPDAFTDTDFRTFTSIAAQTGLALANALANRQLLQREVERQALKLYLPPQIVDMIVASGGMSQLEGVVQPITAMYADIRGFTTMSEQMEARSVVQMLNEFFTAMSDVIFHNNGTLDKFIGDCIMALWGAPVATEKAPREALLAAIGMQKELIKVNQARLRRKEITFQIGIGLHCGSAVVGNIGSADRVQYTAIGDTVNVAARLVNLAQPGQIIVSEDIRKCIPDYAGFQPLGEVELKGRSSKLNIFSVQWEDIPLEE